jgi:MFS family permease
MINAIPGALTLLIFIFIKILGAGVNAPAYIIANNDEDEARKKLLKFYTPYFADKKIVENIQMTMLKRSKSKKVGVWQDIKTFNKEFVMACYVLVAASLVNPAIYYSYSVLIGARDLNDDDAVSAAKAWNFAAVFLEFGGYMAISIFNLNKRRKALFITGQFLYLLCAGCVVLGYILESMTIVRLINVFHGVGAACVFGCCYLYVSDLVPNSLQWIGSFTLGAMSTITTFLAPRLFTEDTTRSQWILIFLIQAGICLLVIVISMIYLIEPSGMSKNEIYDKLRGTKTLQKLRSQISLGRSKSRNNL